MPIWNGVLKCRFAPEHCWSCFSSALLHIILAWEIFFSWHFLYLDRVCPDWEYTLGFISKFARSWIIEPPSCSSLSRHSFLNRSNYAWSINSRRMFQLDRLKAINCPHVYYSVSLWSFWHAIKRFTWGIPSSRLSGATTYAEVWRFRCVSCSPFELWISRRNIRWIIACEWLSRVWAVLEDVVINLQCWSHMFKI